ncbi:MAG: DUF308 domain-containing protein [Clostridia bacterium]|nr:DUF308 domain-containing protein [Clostridia bacterium]
MRGLTIGSGILMIATGAFCFINPGQTFLTMAFVVGTVMVICGIIHLLAYLAGRAFLRSQYENRSDNNGWILIDALLTLLLGILILGNQLTVDSAIPMIFGMWVLVSGLLRVEAASRINRKSKPGNFKAAMITGIVTIVFGLFGFINPLMSFVSVVLLLGLFMLIQGVNSIELGINMPHKRKELKPLEKEPRKAIRIVDEIHETEEEVQKRLEMQKREAENRELVQAFATENIGLSREEAQAAVDRMLAEAESKAKAEGEEKAKAEEAEQ